ncbi:hypothetical protein NAC44_06050 [Allorhizobium sp. BGMRC 0089]|nr:hypothetical protein [Allorhizobium sonneratiae]
MSVAVADWTEIKDFIHQNASSPDLAAVRNSFSDFLSRTAPQDVFKVAGFLSLAHPFYLPPVDKATADALTLTLTQFGELLMRARLTAAKAEQPRVLVACMPKSASTFVTNCLQQVMGVPNVALMGASLTRQPLHSMGITLREQETDELALIQHGCNGVGYVAQHHVRCTPYLCHQLEMYGIRPVVTYRNVFDSFVSLDEMLVGNRRRLSENFTTDALYFDDGMPDTYADLDDETRYMLLVDRQVAWYLQFFLSWKRCEALGLVAPLWVSYEQDFLQNRQGLALRLANFIGTQHVRPEALLDVLARNGGEKTDRFNKGVTGRGRRLPESVRARIRAAFEPYRQDFDFSGILPDDEALQRPSSASAECVL